MALELGCENIRAVRLRPALQLNPRDKPGLTEAVFQRLFSGTKSRHAEKTLWPFPGPMQQLQKAILGTCFLSKCLKLPSLAASTPELFNNSSASFRKITEFF